MYFVTSNNHIAAFSLKAGEIIGIRYRNTFNQQAIEGIKTFSHVRFNFANRDKLNVPEIKDLSTERILESLGSLSLPSESPSLEDKALLDFSPGLSQDTKKALQDLATLYLGPIAPIMSQRVFQQTSDLPTAIRMLAELIPDPSDAQAFLKQARQIR